MFQFTKFLSFPIHLDSSKIVINGRYFDEYILGMLNVIQVGEGLPVDDASVDAVVGTLVLCSVKDVNLTLQGK